MDNINGKQHLLDSLQNNFTERAITTERKRERLVIGFEPISRAELLLHSPRLHVVEPQQVLFIERETMKNDLMLTLAAASMLAGDSGLSAFNHNMHLTRHEQTVASMPLDKLLIEYTLIQKKVSKLSSRERALIINRVQRMLSVEELIALKGEG